MNAEEIMRRDQGKAASIMLGHDLLVYLCYFLANSFKLVLTVFDSNPLSHQCRVNARPVRSHRSSVLNRFSYPSHG